MNFTQVKSPIQFIQAIPIASYRRILLIGILIVAAFSIRLYRSDTPPLDFHATRQYRSLLIARAYLYEMQGSIPEWKLQIARINAERQGILEPPIMERAVAFGYRLFGGENFWIPRFLSSLFWIIGGGFLYLIAKKLYGENAALFSMTFYLFMPFAVIASRSFQPDPFMVVLLLASLFFIMEYFDKLSTFSLIGSYVLSTTTIIIKPVSLFVIFVVFGSLAISRYGIKRSITNPRLFFFFPLTLLPASLSYLDHIFSTGVLHDQVQASFLPQLLITSFFWRGWLNNVREVIGFPILIGALIGVLLAPKGSTRLLLIALWSGYTLFCLTFDYHIATHNYYHLQLIPIVALSLAPLAALVGEHFQEMNPNWYLHMAAASIFSLALILSLIISRAELANPNSESTVQNAAIIGTLVHHSSNTLILASDYGLSLEYHGELSGEPWPLTSDLEWEKLAGKPILNAQERFTSWFAKASPDYFIVEDMTEFDQQPDLKEFLMTKEYSVIAQNEDYIVFDLGGK